MMARQFRAVRRVLAAALALMLGAAAQAVALDVTIGDLQIRDAWIRASRGLELDGAVHMSIRNSGERDTLLGITSNLSKSTALGNATNYANSRPTFTTVENVDIDTGAERSFGERGLQIRLQQLYRPLQPGERHLVILRFRRAGEIALDLPVREVSPEGERRVQTQRARDDEERRKRDNQKPGLSFEKFER